MLVDGILHTILAHMLLMMVFVNPFIQQPVVQHAVKLRVQGIIQHYEEREGSERVPHTQV